MPTNEQLVCVDCPSENAEPKDNMSENTQDATVSTAVRMTFDEYDSFVEQSDSIKLPNQIPYWPTAVDLEKYAPDLGSTEMVKFLVWLVEHNGEPKNECEKASLRTINRYLQENLEFID